MSSFENVDLTITRLSIDVSTPNQSPILLSLAVKPTEPPNRAPSPVPRASTPQAQNNVQSKERMEAERRVEEAKARQREILRQQALEKERQRAEELVKKQQAAYAAAAEAQGQRMEQLRRQEAAKEAERRRQVAEMEQRRREAESRAAEAREQKMREMKAREDRERMIREEARRNFFDQQEQARRNKMAIDAQISGSNAPPSLPPSQYSQPDPRSYEPISVPKKKSPSSFPPLEDYFIKPKQAASPAKPKKAVAKAVRKKSAPPKSAERRSLSARRVTPTVADRPKTGSPLSDRPKSSDKQKMQKSEDQFGEQQGMLQRAASPAPSQPRSARPRTPTGVSLQQSKETKPATPSKQVLEQLGVGVSTMVLSDIDRQFEEEERRLREQKEGKGVDFKIQASSTMMNEIDRQFEEEERHLQAEEKQKSSNYLENHTMMEAKASDVKNGADRVRRLLLGEDEQKDLDEGTCGVKIVRRGEGMNRIKQLHSKNKVDDKKQREHEEKLQQLEPEKKAQAGDKPWLTRGKPKEEKAPEEEKRRIEQEMKDDEEAERRKVVKEAQMREREKRDAERKAFQKLIAKKKKQNRSHSVGDEEDVVILVASNRKPVQTTEAVEQKKEEVSIDVEVLVSSKSPQRPSSAKKAPARSSSARSGHSKEGRSCFEGGQPTSNTHASENWVVEREGRAGKREAERKRAKVVAVRQCGARRVITHPTVNDQIMAILFSETTISHKFKQKQQKFRSACIHLDLRRKSDLRLYLTGTKDVEISSTELELASIGLVPLPIMSRVSRRVADEFSNEIYSLGEERVIDTILRELFCAVKRGD
ncbi:hypothetical protein BLNAU_16995 [Blattamonas nauphoetae]|uniref:Uncharacterized protein n=1 Tax=Blattamonas nauphoetae TaxID=2049346 RepID=A0ABQ9X9W5_9EUKA|nr:hypothetical protein BLNAU_16995 [Blattamonas nauphoetae]